MATASSTAAASAGGATAFAGGIAIAAGESSRMGSKAEAGGAANAASPIAKIERRRDQRAAKVGPDINILDGQGMNGESRTIRESGVGAWRWGGLTPWRCLFSL